MSNTVPRPRPVALTIAGSDSGGGAGIQADLKTFAALGAFGTSVVTAVTAQNTVEVRSIHSVSRAIIRDQIDVVFEDFPVAAVKVGMLGETSTVDEVAAGLERHSGPPVVVDPVMVSKSGASLLAPEAVEALRERLLPLAAIVTPNLPEAEVLLGRSLTSVDERLAGALELARRGPAVLLKGGHAGGDEVVDLLAAEGRGHQIRHPRIDTRACHGTGCTLSAAIAAGLAAGRPLVAAVEEAIAYLAGALAGSPRLGRGAGPMDHLYALLPPEGD